VTNISNIQLVFWASVAVLLVVLYGFETCRASNRNARKLIHRTGTFYVDAYPDSQRSRGSQDVPA
jgi:hypothetical protein